jgi:hypothetical protein
MVLAKKPYRMVMGSLPKGVMCQLVRQGCVVDFLRIQWVHHDNSMVTVSFGKPEVAISVIT